MTDVKITDQEAADCIQALWTDAMKISSFDVVCTLLRVDGMQDPGWDPFEETKEALKDFNWYLKVEDEALSPKSHWRMGLLMYCQAVEMSAGHSTLANLLRILLGQKYHLNPLCSLGRADKKRMFKFYPPSATVKWRKLRDMAVEANRDELVRLLDAIYNNDVRNAFSHSDYVLTETHFRFTEGGLFIQVPLEQVGNLISNAFSFFGTFLGARNHWLEVMGQMPRYHKWPRHEVLELVVDENKKLSGFRVHFSNGSAARFSRTPEGLDCTNIMIQGDGTIKFFVGSLDMLGQTWKVDGQPVDFGGSDAVDGF